MTDTQHLIAEERRLRVTHDEAYRAEIAARNAHHEAKKVLEAALIEDGGYHKGQEIKTQSGTLFRVAHIYLDYKGKHLIAACNRLRKGSGKVACWTVAARDTLILKTLED